MGSTAGGKVMKKNGGWKGGLLLFALYMRNKESDQSVRRRHDFIFSNTKTKQQSKAAAQLLMEA